MGKSWVASSILCLNPGHAFIKRLKVEVDAKNCFWDISHCAQMWFCLQTQLCRNRYLLKEPTHPFSLKFTSIERKQVCQLLWIILITWVWFWHGVGWNWPRQFCWWEWEVQRRLKAKDLNFIKCRGGGSVVTNCLVWSVTSFKCLDQNKCLQCVTLGAATIYEHDKRY